MTALRLSERLPSKTRHRRRANFIRHSRSPLTYMHRLLCQIASPHPDLDPFPLPINLAILLQFSNPSIVTPTSPARDELVMMPSLVQVVVIYLFIFFISSSVFFIILESLVMSRSKSSATAADYVSSQQVKRADIVFQAFTVTITYQKFLLNR